LGDNASPLAQIPTEFLRVYGRRLSYSMLWRLAVEGAIPVARLNGCLYLDRADLPQVAAALETRRRRPTAA
jgi:hypothetical protein